jgi:predicted nucleic acid-binding Zn ribbon protein
MAITVTTLCVICGAPVGTKRATKNRTCSHTCYMRLNRANKRKLVVIPETQQPEAQTQL